MKKNHKYVWIILAAALMMTWLFSFAGCAKKYDDDIPVKEGYLRTADIRIRDISVVVLSLKPI